MRDRQTVLALVLCGVMILAALGVLVFTHWQALVMGGQGALAPSAPNYAALNIPSVAEMCALRGATAESLDQCRAEGEAAAEFVIAWMGLNGFLVNGAIDLEQIALQLELGPDPLSPLSEPDPVIEAGPEAFAGDSFAGDSDIARLGDPLAGEHAAGFASPAEIAAFCLSSFSDWVNLQACLSEHDPSTRFEGP